MVIEIHIDIQQTIMEFSSGDLKLADFHNPQTWSLGNSSTYQGSWAARQKCWGGRQESQKNTCVYKQSDSTFGIKKKHKNTKRTVVFFFWPLLDDCKYSRSSEYSRCSRYLPWIQSIQHRRTNTASHGINKLRYCTVCRYDNVFWGKLFVVIYIYSPRIE